MAGLTAVHRNGGKGDSQAGFTRLKLQADAEHGSLSSLSTSSSDVALHDLAERARSKMLRVCAAVSSAGLYGATAVAMNFFNKAALMHFSLANTLLLLQMVATILIVQPIRWAGILDIPPLSLAKAKQLAPVTILYTANVCFALLGLAALNVPMYNVLKRLTPCMILGVKAAMQRKAPPGDITASVLLVVAGCLIAGLGDFTFDAFGYTCALLSCGLQTGYLILVERSGAEKGIGSAELLLYNALLSIPFLLVAVVSTGEVVRIVPAAAQAAAEVGGLHAALLLGACACMGVLLNYSLFLCTMHNSALTTTIVGVLKGVLAMGLGFVLLGGVEPHALNVAGIVVNMIGGSWYSIIKFRQKAARNDDAAGSQHGGKVTPTATAAPELSSNAFAVRRQAQHRNGQYTAVAAQADDVLLRIDSGGSGGSDRFPGFTPTSPFRLARERSLKARELALLAAQAQQGEDSEATTGTLIGSSPGGFSPRRTQAPWLAGNEQDAAASELAAGGLAADVAGGGRSRRNSTSAP